LSKKARLLYIVDAGIFNGMLVQCFLSDHIIQATFVTKFPGMNPFEGLLILLVDTKKKQFLVGHPGFNLPFNFLTNQMLLEAKNEEEATQINGHNEQEQNGNGLFHGVKIKKKTS
jgi:hypothetical protein